MTYAFSPGCALMLYKPRLAQKLHAYLNYTLGEMPLHLRCCHYEPQLPHDTYVINVCAGCDRRFRSLYDGVRTRSLYEIIAERGGFDFPNYSGVFMSLHDPCPIRTEERVHIAVRVLLARMNITIVEAEHNRTNSVCCGDSYYPVHPIDKVTERMKSRAAQMPCDDVAVYCVSCVKSMANGGKTPRHIVDLLFGEDTVPGECDTVKWHEMVDGFANQDPVDLYRLSPTLKKA